MNISTATMTDVSSIVALVNSAYRGEGAKKGWTTEADLLDGIRTDESALAAMLHKTGAAMLVCHNGAGELIGCVYLEQQPGTVYLGMLTVSPLLQAAGIGKQLLLAAEDFAKKNGADNISMTVISVRGELIAWYERHGYAKTGERKPFPTDTAFGIPKQPLEFVVMKKML